MTLTRKEKNLHWQVDQLDPDNWLRIPEFGVMPVDVMFEGFQFPIVHPAAKNHELMEELRSQVRRARKLAKRSYAKLAELRAAYIDVIDAFELGGTATSVKEVDAARYMIFIREAERLCSMEDAMALISGIEKLEADLAEWAQPVDEWFNARKAQAGVAATSALNKFRRP
jgi:hypothetical protein